MNVTPQPVLGIVGEAIDGLAPLLHVEDHHRQAVDDQRDRHQHCRPHDQADADQSHELLTIKIRLFDVKRIQ